MTVKFYTTERLVQRFCTGNCTLADVCKPSVTKSEESDRSGLNYLVAGSIAASECPIMARMWPFAGWVDARNHKGRCGEQEQ